MAETLPKIDLIGHKQYRIIPSVYPPINFFEDLVDASEMAILFEIESLTNERLLQQAGNVFLVEPEDCVSGAGSSVVMAAFTHVGYPSRFTDGSFGIYYASFSLETAIQETIYHREKFLSATKQPACELTMRGYQGKVLQLLDDVRASQYDYLHHPFEYSNSQRFGEERRDEKSWGLLYNSVRHSGGQCLAALRPPAISIPVQSKHLRYVWNGMSIIDVLDVKSIM